MVVVRWCGTVGLAIAKRPRVAQGALALTGGAVILAIFFGDTTVKARFSSQTTACGVCPGALLHLGVMLLWGLQKSRVRGCASKQCAALPPPPQRRSPRRWRKIEAGFGLVMEKNDSRLVEWCSERWSSGGLVR